MKQLILFVAVLSASSLVYSPAANQESRAVKDKAATQQYSAGTCRQLVVALNDGSVHRANFKFNKT